MDLKDSNQNGLNNLSNYLMPESDVPALAEYWLCPVAWFLIYSGNCGWGTLQFHSTHHTRIFLSQGMPPQSLLTSRMPRQITKPGGPRGPSPDFASSGDSDCHLKSKEAVLAFFYGHGSHLTLQRLVLCSTVQTWLCFTVQVRHHATSLFV